MTSDEGAILNGMEALQVYDRRQEWQCPPLSTRQEHWPLRRPRQTREQLRFQQSMSTTEWTQGWLLGMDMEEAVLEAVNPIVPVRILSSNAQE